jgi:hypothetical protein
MRTGKVAGNEFGDGGGIQHVYPHAIYESDPPKSWFQKVKELTEALREDALVEAA